MESELRQSQPVGRRNQHAKLVALEKNSKIYNSSKAGSERHGFHNNNSKIKVATAPNQTL